MDEQPNPRKSAFVIIGGILAIFALIWLWHFYHTGRIIITTNDPHNTIVVNEVGANGQRVGTQFKGHNRVSITVSTGKYAVSVTGNSVATVQSFKLKPRATARYTINPINATGVEPVAYEDAQDIMATADRLVYLGAPSDDDDGGSRVLNTIDGQNNIKDIDSDYSLQTVKWAGPSFGVGQDDDGRLYTVAGESVRPLKVPFLYGHKAVNFDVSSGKTIYVSYGADVYAGSQNGGFHKIYTASSSRPTLAAGNGIVAVSDTKYGGEPNGISKSLLATVDTSGKKSKKNIEAERMAWSPDGKHLAAVNDSNPTIYDAGLHAISVVPNGSTVGQLAWLNDSTLLYSLGGELWTYSLSGQRAQLLANMPLSDAITGLYISEDGSYVYVTTLNPASESHVIRRIGLKGQKVPDYIYSLQDAMPLSLPSYSLELVNFSGTPTIIMKIPPSIGPKPTEQQAVQELQGLGFDTSKLRFVVEIIKT